MSAGFKKDYGWQDLGVEHLLANVDMFYSREPGQFKRAFVVQVSPSGGKSRFSLKANAKMVTSNLIDKAIYVAPRNSIKLGFADDCKAVTLPEAHQLQGCEHLCIDTDLPANYRGALKNFHGVVITYHSLKKFHGLFEMWARMGLRLMFIFDEAHHGAAGGEEDDDATANVWGEAMRDVGDIACCIVVMTGTPVRTDQKPVPHFEYEVRDVIDPISGEIAKSRHVKSDFTFSYRDAVTAGVARRLIIRNQDALVTAVCEGEEVTEKLSGMTRARIAKAKRLLLYEHAENIDDMLRIAKEENDRDRRTGDERAAIMVVVPNTARDGRNPLAYVAERIEALFGEYAVAVESADGPEAYDAIRRFKNGAMRWIVCKNMISEGTNLPRVRVVCILRDIRSQVFYEQLVHRATRNASDEVPQDAKVVQWRLPTLYEFGRIIEEETRLSIIKQKPRCPSCEQEIEFRPRPGRPCPLCGHEPEPWCGPPPPPEEDYVPIRAKIDDEEVHQGGDDFSKYDGSSRQILDRLGPNPRYGGRDGINEVLRMADRLGGILPPEGGAAPAPNALLTPPPGQRQDMDRYQDGGMANCKKAAGIVSRRRASPYNETLRQIVAGCKRQAGMGTDSFEKVRRDHRNPVAAFQKFFSASQAELNRAGRS